MENSEKTKLISDRFTFEYEPCAVRINYPKRQPRAEKRHCVVEIFKKNGRAEVIVTEDDRDRRSREKKLDFADVVFQLRQAGHFEKPTWIREDDVTWYKRVLLDKKGRDVLYRAQIGERSDWTFRPRIKFRRELVFGDFRVRGIGLMADHSLIIRTGGIMASRPWILPLSLYPSLSDASPGSVGNYRLNRNRTVVYWPDLKERLFAKDAIVFGERTQKKPDGISDAEFIEQPVTPRSV